MSSPLIDAQRIRYSNPVAFAFGDSGYKFIWIAKESSFESNFPDWQSNSRLLGTLLHEIGHVLGTGHHPFTIMREDFMELLKSKESESKNYLLEHIDGEAELFGCGDCGVFVNRSLDQMTHDANGFFRELIGHEPVGNVQLSLTFEPSFPSPQIRLFIRDQLGESTFLILLMSAQNIGVPRTVFSTKIESVVNHLLAPGLQWLGHLSSGRRDLIFNFTWNARDGLGGPYKLGYSSFSNEPQYRYITFSR